MCMVIFVICKKKKKKNVRARERARERQSVTEIMYPPSGCSDSREVSEVQ